MNGTRATAILSLSVACAVGVLAITSGGRVTHEPLPVHNPDIYSDIKAGIESLGKELKDQHRSILALQESLRVVRRLPVQSGDNGVSDSGGQNLTSLQAKIEELGSSIADLQASVDGLLKARAAQPTPQDIAQGKPVTDYTELDALCTQMKTDPNATRSALLLQAPGGILSRFGPPTSITSDGTWRYNHPKPGKGQFNEVDIDYFAGQVSAVAIRWTYR